MISTSVNPILYCYLQSKLISHQVVWHFWFFGPLVTSGAGLQIRLIESSHYATPIQSVSRQPGLVQAALATPVTLHKNRARSKRSEVA
ncbi:hypothetical protein RB195_007651 [Necator americanus]